MTQRDPDIIKAVNDCQALTVPQLITLFWNSPNPAYTTLRRLIKLGLLEKEPMTIVGKPPASSSHVYTITKPGAALLADWFGYTSEDLHFASRQTRSWSSYRSLKMANDVRVALTRACWDSEDYELVNWQNEAAFRADPDYVYIRNKRTPVYPDGYCVISGNGIRTYNFIESDGGTEGLQQVTRQMRIYLEYVASGLYEQRFGTAFWRVILVTNSIRRMNNIRKRVAEIGGGVNFLFSTFDDISPESVLADPIWYGIRGEERRRFL